jgi:hypothetical protein
MNKNDLKGSIDYILNSNCFEKDIKDLSKNFDYYSEIGHFKDWLHVNVFCLIPITTLVASLGYLFSGGLFFVFTCAFFCILNFSLLLNHEISGKPFIYSCFPSKYLSFLKNKKKKIKSIYERNKFLFKIITIMKNETSIYSNSYCFTHRRYLTKKQIIFRLLSNYKNKNGHKKFITDLSDILRNLNVENADKDETDVIFDMFDDVTEEYRKTENRKRLITENCSLPENDKKPLLKEINDKINQIPLISMVRKL